MVRTDSSIVALLQERAEQQPDALAFTYIDYEQDPSGFAEGLTWSQLFRRACTVAEELALWGSPGDRVAIVAPQGLEYVVGFLGALQASLIAVPLSTPQYGVHDDRISAVLRDCNPVAVLTTSAVVHEVAKYATAHQGEPTPFVIEIDLLDLDSPREQPAVTYFHSGPAYLQYTSGSTRTPAGVVVTHQNVMANIRQLISDTFEDHGKAAPPETTIVIWLPFYHDLGLMCGIALPIVTGRRIVFMSPMAFLQKPARWMQVAARNTRTYTGGPNFAYELAVRRTTDEDMAGLDLGHVHTFAFAAERVHAATIKRFVERFARFNLRDTALKPGYGLAEATVYATSNPPGLPPTTARFDYQKLSAGYAEPSGDHVGVDLVSCGVPRAVTVRIVDPDTRVENPAGKVGEIWIHGDNVAAGYWRNPQASECTFRGKLVDPSPGTPEGPWLRTGDLGFFSDGELFIVGRIKDLLIVDGRNHSPDDIEATIQEITGGRCAAIAVPTDISELLVAIIELKRRGTSAEDVKLKLSSVKHEVTSAISKAHGLRVADLVLVAPGSIPITTSGKIRRSTCIERYRSDGFERLDTTV
ncbi:acyl-CoA synthetase [Mycobacterium alsense]|uniref:AMP-binding protein n=1 Tax=Mycobacterium alsense TaxID=324058 RepID=A0AA41XP67_9MYCO|nr:AMP-binding protein [Mycobacterium alsense]MCV7379891.1 AMP-binding protein [Mycobacterium alsense]OQZ87741.1 acyl-CoA synthetase [Mycobacterium alsense]